MESIALLKTNGFTTLLSSFSVPIFDVHAVVGTKAELPCDIDPADPTDDVYLVLWYRHEAGKPLYRCVGFGILDAFSFPVCEKDLL